MTVNARVLGHDGRVLANLVLDRPTFEVRIAVMSRDLMSRTVAMTRPLMPENDHVAVYEQTADDGTRIYRLRVSL